MGVRMQRIWLIASAAILAIAVMTGLWLGGVLKFSESGDTEDTLNLLAWSGYDDPNIIAAFEKEYHIKVHAKTFFGGDGMLALLSQSPSTYDVIVVDKDYLNKLYRANRLKELNRSDFDLSNYFKPFVSQPYSTINGKLYGVMVEWGTSALVYNSKKVTASQAESYSVLWDPAVKGRVGLWDWYLPNMGDVSLSLGNSKPYDLDESHFDALTRRLDALRPQVAAFHESSAEIVAGLVRGDTWVVPGGGEWLASIAAQQGAPVTWTIPKEGGLMWVDVLVIPTDAPHKSAALKYIQWLTTAKAQALLSQKSSFHSNIPNRGAYALLTDKQRALLEVDANTDLNPILAKLSDRTLPPGAMEKRWQDIWEQFKAMH